MICYVCNTKITKDNETEEHIIINAIGGRLKSKQLICRQCNSVFGSGIDDKLSQQLNPIANFLDVKRDRGTPQNVKGTYKNREIIIEPGGKIRLARTYMEKGEKVYHIEASSTSEATKVLKGLKRSHPELNLDEAIEKLKPEQEYLPSINVGMNFGGVEINRAICKMAVNFFVYHSGEHDTIKHLLPFINGNVDEAEMFYFYPRTEVLYKGEEEVMHSLLLIGDPDKKQLYVYVELFNEFKFIVFLDNNYEDKPVYESYHYNVVNNEVIQYENPIQITKKDLKKYCSKELELSKFNERMKLLFQRIDNFTVNKKIHEISKSAIDDMQKKFPQDKVFTREMIAFLANKVAHEFVTAFQHRIIRQN